MRSVYQVVHKRASSKGNDEKPIVDTLTIFVRAMTGDPPESDEESLDKILKAASSA